MPNETANITYIKLELCGKQVLCPLDAAWDGGGWVSPAMITLNQQTFAGNCGAELGVSSNGGVYGEVAS